MVSGMRKRVGELATTYYGKVLAIEYVDGKPFTVETTKDGYDFDDSRSHGLLFSASGDTVHLPRNRKCAIGRSYWFADAHAPAAKLLARAKRVGAKILPAPLHGDPFEKARECVGTVYCTICRERIPDEEESYCTHLFWVYDGNGTDGPGTDNFGECWERRFLIPVTELAVRAGIARRWRHALVTGKLDWSYGFLGSVYVADVRAVADRMETASRGRANRDRAWGWFRALDAKTPDANRATIEWLDLVIQAQNERRESGAAVYAIRVNRDYETDQERAAPRCQGSPDRRSWHGTWWTDKPSDSTRRPWVDALARMKELRASRVDAKVVFVRLRPIRNRGIVKRPEDMSDGEIEAEIEAQYRKRDAATDMAGLTREHRRLRSLQSEAARRIEERFRKTRLMPPENGEPDILDQAQALIEKYGGGR